MSPKPTTPHPAPGRDADPETEAPDKALVGPSAAGDVTQLLRRWRAGDMAALDALLPNIGDDLARVARARLRDLRRRRRDEGMDVTLDTGGLVNEAWLVISKQRNEWKNREQFFAIAARRMRQICCDHAKRATRKKRTPPPAAELARHAPAPDDALELLELDRALARLETTDPRLVRIVELKFFAGLEDAETARALAVSVRTVRREWAFARAWLHRELTKGAR